jgi:hypothetical protein
MVLLILISLLLLSTTPVQAVEGEILGIHILSPHEANQAKQLVEFPQEESQPDQEQDWHYVTIPFSLDDLNRKDEWQTFFNQAHQLKLIPIVRLTTKFEDKSWKIPNRKEITDQISFLNDLNWPTNQKHIIIYNEVNHAAEWSGELDPASYAEVLKFSYQWAKSEDQNFVVLPAALDLAAANTAITQESFYYLRQLTIYEPEIFEYIDAWNSHSYPNPGFSSSPYRTGKNSLRGFEHELAYIDQYTKQKLDVYITETGWKQGIYTTPYLERYYQYAVEKIWKQNDRIIAVTPFLLNGSPGPFADFSFLDETGQPTSQYLAFKKALKESSN